MGDPVHRHCEERHRRSHPSSRKLVSTKLALTLCLLAASLAAASSAAAGAWKHEVVANDGDVLTYTEDGKQKFFLGCGRGFAPHVKYPGTARKDGEAEIALSTSKGRMRFIGWFEDPEVFGGTDFAQTYLGYDRHDPLVFGKKWNAIKAQLLNMLDADGPITVSAGSHSYQLPAIDAGAWHKGLEECKN
jgi:hypothetical protein